MILTQTDRNIERSGIRVERQATIQADSVAFKVLSDMLYPDKPLAIIRELLCNAYDSHTDAGCPDRPVEIHLPNVMEPYLSIRDYGLGLSFRDACVLMLTYFKSTKRNSNAVTGALGLGSKTPFAYVDSYTVTTRFNGRKFVFNAFINETGMPAMALLARERTDEPNGVEIMVPVRKNDFSTFVDRAQNVIQWFRIHPIVTGCNDFKTHKHIYDMTGSNWSISTNQNHYHSNSLAIQGNIAYQIDYRSLTDLPSLYGDLLRYAIHFTFPIGSIGFTAGRDAISYDEKTVVNLKNALDQFVDEMPKHAQARFDECTSEWEARCAYDSLLGYGNVGSILRTINKLKKLSYTWNGILIESSNVHISMDEIPNSSISIYFGKRRSVHSGVVKNPLVTAYKLEIHCQKSAKIIVDDLPRGGLARVRILAKKDRHDANIKFIRAENDAELKLILRRLGNPPVIKTSSLDAPKRQVGINKTTVRKYDINSIGPSACGWRDITDDDDFENGGLYVPLLRDRAINDNREQIINFDHILYDAKRIAILEDDEVVYGASPKLHPKFENDTSWLNAMTELTSRVQKIIIDEKLDAKFSRYISHTDWSGAIPTTYSAFRFVEFDLAFGAKHPLSLFKQKIVSETLTSREAVIFNLANNLRIKFKKQINFHTEWDQIIAQYPMMVVLGYNSSRSYAPTIINYVKQMDELLVLKKQIDAINLAT